MKKLLFVAPALLGYFSLAVPAFAQASVDLCTTPGNNPVAQVLCKLGGSGGENTANTLRSIIVFFVILAIIVALIYLLYGGLKWVTSRGEKDQVEAARNHIIAAIIGLIVVILAIFIVTIILAAFGLDFSKLQIPTIGSK